MKKTILTLLLSLFILGCNNKSTEKKEKVESDPVTVQIKRELVFVILQMVMHNKLMDIGMVQLTLLQIGM